ncbi:hypothetical protein EPA93_25310 [Ktedonosporobacter rubrisoli]|uniref:Uncharacterized protein n=1 Tax=Ktedonosporobacter rubrisoli TaxID=2509675 RepID=A0A4P6JUX5_KTERU|nr:hypothetical protein [Ktedonosporobacter rubrisoli]QBD79120.1 hypothetical protein EPA93_25310 [Ktedonosporobacter rubrisoli]
MTTTGELHAIIEELELVDIGDAASYLGEEATLAQAAAVQAQGRLTRCNDVADFLRNEHTSCWLDCLERK